MTTTWVQDIAFFGACVMAFSIGYGTGWARGTKYAIARMLADIQSGELKRTLDRIIKRFETT